MKLYGSADTDTWTRGLFSAQNIVRAMCETPASEMTPVASSVWIKAKKMTALKSVPDSSCVPPFFLEINYCSGEINEPPIFLVGEGLAAAKFSLPMIISAVIPLCENMPLGKAFKPGNIVTSGKSILLHDTNNAGVLIMADALTYAQNTMGPKLVVSIGTLSNGVQKAFGSAAAGFFSTSHFIAEELMRAAAISGDRVRELPAWQYFTKK